MKLEPAHLRTSSSFAAALVAVLSSTVLGGCGLARTAGGRLGLGDPSGAAGASVPSAPSTPSVTSGSGPAAATAGASSTAATGPAARPSWCDDYRYPRSTVVRADWFADNTDEELIGSLKVAEELAGAVCATRWDDPAARADLMAFRARWMDLMGYDEADFVVAAGEAKGYVEDAQDFATVSGPASQLADGQPTLDELGARASMLVRFDVVDECLREAFPPPPRTRDLLGSILCTRERLDGAAALAEIEASKDLTARSRKDLRHLVRRTAVRAADAAAWVDARAKDDPGVARLVAIADAQFAEWARPTPQRTKLAEALQAMEAATRSDRRSAFTGCDATTRAAWEATVRTRKLPKIAGDRLTAELVRAVLPDADGYLAFRALRLCSAASESAPGRGSFLLDESTIRRGPRSATFAAWIAASGDIVFDDRGLSMGGLLGAFGVNSPPTIAGTIESVSDRGDEVEISFAPRIVAIDVCEASRVTSRIERIDSDGTVRYVSECLRWGKGTIDRAPEPILVGKVMAHGLTRGMFLTALTDGLPLAATSGAGSTTATWVLGATVR